MVRNRAKSTLSCWINTFPHKSKSYTWHNTLYSSCTVDKRVMSEKKKQHHHQHRNRILSSSSPPPPASPNTLPPSSLVSSPVSTSTMDDYSWGNRSTELTPSAIPLPPPSSPMEVVNDRFIHETGPPTALSILRTQPAFIGKLYKMLEDGSQDLICWSSIGDYFSVYNSALFSKEILPQYFKHNNWQSFVRQLNMYGFSKINEMIHSNISVDNQTWDFKHPHFKRGDFQSLILVKRKPVRPSPTSVSGNISNSTTSSALVPSSPYMPAPNNGMFSPDGRTRSSSSSSSSSSESYQQQQQQQHQQQQQQHHQQQQEQHEHTMEEEGSVENRVLQLDEQVYRVSNNVNLLTHEIQDIKSLIQRQQTMIHDLANLVRSYNDASSSKTVAKMLSSSSKTSSLENPRPRNTSLPSIHNLAGDLDTVTNTQQRAHDRHHHHHQHHPHHQQQQQQKQKQKQKQQQQQSHPLNVTSFFNINSSGLSLPHLHRRRSASPPLTDHHQRRRSSHPSSASRTSHPIHPLLNSNPNDDEDPEHDHDDGDMMDENH